MWRSIINILNPYFYFTICRTFFYDWGFLKIRKAPIPVISVGNISCGGTGKTSVVRYLATSLQDLGPLLILSRGYKRSSKGFLWVLREGNLMARLKEAGDEPYLLGLLFANHPKIHIAVCEDRYLGIRQALKEVRFNLVILDDAFQHRALYRDVDLVLLKKKDLKDLLLPFGRLREPLYFLKRAHAIILAFQEIQSFNYSHPFIPVFKMYRKNFKVLNSSLEPVDPQNLPELIAFAGLGDNQQFFLTLQKLGLKIKEKIGLSDHFSYQDFLLHPQEYYITTLKDFIKLKPSPNLYLLDFDIEIPELMNFLKNKLK